MTNHASLFAGLLVGFSIATPVGPMALLCIQRTLSSGMRVGVSTGLGAATVNVAYGGLILLGLQQLAPWMASGGRVLGALGGMVLLWSAARTLLRGPSPSRPVTIVTQSPLAAYSSAVAFNAANPMAPMLIIALLTPIMGRSTPTFGDAAVLLVGMFTAAAAWWVCLSGGVALLRTRLSPAVLAGVNRTAGLVLTAYGALALAHSLRP